MGESAGGKWNWMGSRVVRRGNAMEAALRFRSQVDVDVVWASEGQSASAFSHLSAGLCENCLGSRSKDKHHRR